MKKLILIFPVLFLWVGNIQAQTILNTLQELVPYLDDDNANVKVAPGTYTITAADITAGTYGSVVPGVLASTQYAVFLFSGNNSTYDFTGVTINFKTEILSAFGVNDTREIQIIGNNNVLLNLTMVDDGSVNDAPADRATNIVIDGANNRVEGFHVSVKGSYPYGYGDIFGKGGGSVINHHKHSACLVRGNSNHLKNCTFIHRSYGHGIFMQAANDALIEGCHVEGELRTIAEVLAEEGTGSPADNVNFLTVWGYDLRNLTNNYRFSLHEDGIRDYNGGTTIIDGVEYERTVYNTTVINCTIIKMRSGVTLGLGRGTQNVTNCTALACESGFWVRDNGNIVNSRGDASVGPLYSEDASRSGVTADLTLLDNYVDKIGNTPSLYMGGSNHNFTLHDGTTSFNNEIEILIGGKRYAHRFLEGSGEEPAYRDTNNVTLINNTQYPIVLGDNATNNNVTTCGIVTDNGSGNTITNSTTCDYDRPCDNTADNLQAECYDTMFGVAIQDIAGGSNEREVFDINAGDWLSFNTIDLTGVVSIEVKASGVKNDVSLEVRQGSQTGTLLATIPISSTSSYSTYQTFSADLNQAVNGLSNVYFVANTGSQTGELFNIDMLRFAEDPCGKSIDNPFARVNAEDFCDSSGVVVEDLSVFNKVVSNIENTDYIKFPNVNFGTDTVYNTINILAASATTGGTLEIRSDAIDGNILATVTIENTGDWNQYNSFSGTVSNPITGVHDLYFIFKGTSGYLFKLDWFQFTQYIPELTNLALATNGGIASQSTTDYSGEASRGNDGNTNGNFGGNSVTHTAHGTNGSNTLKWWQVDLGANKAIWEIVIYGRTGSNYINDLNNFTVEVLNAHGDVTFTQFYANYPSVRPLTIDTGNITGKIVRVSKTSDRGLSLAEVEVYGTSTLSVNNEVVNNIKIYPNPVSDVFRITESVGASVEIYNIDGKLLLKKAIENNNQALDISNFTSGLYFAKIENEGKVVIKKIIKH